MSLRRVYERRASTVLHHLAAAETPGPWILPANVCSIVPLTLMKAGRAFEFIDIDDRLCLDAAAVEERLARNPRPAAVLWVRTYGFDRDERDTFERLREASPGTIVIDDRCLCPPVAAAPDTNADVALYSTGYAKVLDLGGGGYAWLSGRCDYVARELVYDAESLEAVTERCKQAVSERTTLEDASGDWLETGKPETPWDSYRERIMRALPPALAHKSRINALYREAAPADARLGDAYDGWRFHLRVDDKAALLKTIFDAGLFASSHFDALTGVFGPGEAPRAEALHARVVNLFNDGYYSLEQAERTAGIVREHLEAGA